VSQILRLPSIKARRRAALLLCGVHVCCGFCGLRCLVVRIDPMKHKPYSSRISQEIENGNDVRQWHGRDGIKSRGRI